MSERTTKITKITKTRTSKAKTKASMTVEIVPEPVNTATVHTVNTVNTEPKAPRGRKAKSKVVVPVEHSNVVVIPEITANTANTANTTNTVVPKRKKQFSVVAIVTPNGIEGSLQPEIRKPLIAHLPIQSSEVIFHDNNAQYNPIPPTAVEAYNAMSDDPFQEGVEVIQPAVIPKQQAPSVVVEGSVPIPDYYKKGTLLVQYQATEEIRKIPEQVDIACFWCCHRFETRPVVLPVKDQGEYIEVQGNFCTPECSMSYLFDQRMDSYSRWEQLSLLNRIYGVDEPIKPAPPRQILKLFGGPMGIEEYRNIVRKRILRVDIHLPPMVSLLATMDTKPIDFYDVSLTKNVMETVKERLDKAEQVLKLKRTKPLKAWESTLDACINLKVRSG